MKAAAENVAEQVIDALKHRGFEFIGRADDGWLKLRGALQTPEERRACEIELDPQFFELPRVRLLDLPATLPHVTPHLGSGGNLCYIAKGTVVIDIFDPAGQTLACLRRAEEILEKVLRGEFVEDLEEEFYVYWNGPLCLVDMQDQRLGRQEALVIRPGGQFTAVVTDDKVRSARKLKTLGWEATDYTMLAYRVRTTARPRPHTSVWPPTTVQELLAWQGLMDLRCRRKIQSRIREALATAAKGALVLVESPLMTYGFVVSFDRTSSPKHLRRLPAAAMFALGVTPMSVMRLDDRYMAERNIPGMQTLAGKRLVLVGCGTIGGYLAEILIKAGAGTSGGQLTLVDSESLYPQNIGRHRLGFPSLFQNKATALADEMKRMAPGADIRPLPVNVQRAELGDVELLIDATGEESLGHWLCKKYLPVAPMLSVWVEGPGVAVRALLRAKNDAACYRCLCDANRKGLFATVVGAIPTLMAGHGCEGLYVPFPASVSLQAASLGGEMVVAWANKVVSPSLRTTLIDGNYQLATPDCDPPSAATCPACSG